MKFKHILTYEEIVKDWQKGFRQFVAEQVEIKKVLASSTGLGLTASANMLRIAQSSISVKESEQRLLHEAMLKIASEDDPGKKQKLISEALTGKLRDIIWRFMYERINALVPKNMKQVGNYPIDEGDVFDAVAIAVASDDDFAKFLERYDGVTTKPLNYLNMIVARKIPFVIKDLKRQYASRREKSLQDTINSTSSGDNAISLEDQLDVSDTDESKSRGESHQLYVSDPAEIEFRKTQMEEELKALEKMILEDDYPSGMGDQYINAYNSHYDTYDSDFEEPKIPRNKDLAPVDTQNLLIERNKDTGKTQRQRRRTKTPDFVPQIPEAQSATSGRVYDPYKNDLISNMLRHMSYPNTFLKNHPELKGAGFGSIPMPGAIRGKITSLEDIDNPQTQDAVFAHIFVGAGLDILYAWNAGQSNKNNALQTFKDSVIEDITNNNAITEKDDYIAIVNETTPDNFRSMLDHIAAGYTHSTLEAIRRKEFTNADSQQPRDWASLNDEDKNLMVDHVTNTYWPEGGTRTLKGYEPHPSDPRKRGYSPRELAYQDREGLKQHFLDTINRIQDPDDLHHMPLYDANHPFSKKRMRDNRDTMAYAVNKLIRIASIFEANGKFAEADIIDGVINEYAEE